MRSLGRWAAGVVLVSAVWTTACSRPFGREYEYEEQLYLSVDAVKAHLRQLFERLGIDELPQNQKRARLAAVALVDGLVRQHDF